MAAPPAPLTSGVSRSYFWGDDVPAVVVAGPQGAVGDHDPAGFYPAEDHFRMTTVHTHGGLADLTWRRALAAAADSRPPVRRTFRPATSR